MMFLLKHTLWICTKNLFWAGWWLLGLLALIWVGLHSWMGDRFWPVRLVNYLMPWLLVGLVPGLVLALFGRHRVLAAVLAIPVLFISAVYAPLFLPSTTPALASGTSFKVMSYNVLYINLNLAAMTSVIRQEQPDILLLQEVTPFHAQFLPAELADLYPDGQLHIAYEKQVGQAVISRYPITRLGLEPWGRTLKVRLDTPAGPITVWNIHAATPIHWQRQYEHLSALAEEVTGVEGPLIVGGDFNTTDQSDTYRLIAEHLDNAHWESGWGFGFSFPAQAIQVKHLPVPVPVIRIDHIFYSQDFLAHHARTLSDSGGSDHFPIVATLSLGR